MSYDQVGENVLRDFSPFGIYQKRVFYVYTNRFALFRSALCLIFIINVFNESSIGCGKSMIFSLPVIFYANLGFIWNWSSQAKIRFHCISGHIIYIAMVIYTSVKGAPVGKDLEKSRDAFVKVYDQLRQPLKDIMFKTQNAAMAFVSIYTKLWSM